MLKPFQLSICSILVGALLLGADLGAKRFNLLVNASATDEYVKRASELEYQTYHFVKGKYWGGSTRDRSLEEAQFEDLAESLSHTLRRRKMYPETSRELGDLLIMISWGRTSLDPNYRELQGITSMGDMASADSQDQASSGGNLVPASGGENPIMVPSSTIEPSSDSGAGQSFGDGGGSQRSRNRTLLGLQRALEGPNPFGLSKDQALWDALDEERYFVVLNAFDYQHLLKEKELKQVWSVRYNTRAIGIGFQKAYDSMTDAVAGVIGLNSDDVVMVKGDTEGRVSLGELEVIDMSEEEKRLVEE